MSPSVAATSSPTIASPSSCAALLGFLSLPREFSAAPFFPFSPSPWSSPFSSPSSPHSGPMNVNSTCSSCEQKIVVGN